MYCTSPLGFAWIVALAAGQVPASSQERPYGRGLTEANRERLVIDDMHDLSGWSNESPVETTLSSSTRFVKHGAYSLKFGNVVDYTRGEKNYPVGWPRTSKNLVKRKLTDWSAYDFFECWIYVDTSREALPGVPLGLSFNHPGSRVTTNFALKEVKKDQWVRIVIPLSKLLAPREVLGVKFHIAEANYRHGDRVDFYINDMVLTRFIDPTVAELDTDRKVIYTHDHALTAQFALMGHQDLDTAKLQFEIGPLGAAMPAAAAEGRAVRRGELPLIVSRPLTAGDYWARLRLRDAQGKLIDQKEVEFRVVPGPFE